jgi:hypothetical protein
MAAASLAHPVPASAQAVDPAFQRDIEKMLEMTGAAKLGEQIAGAVVQQVGQSMRQSNPSVPVRAIDIMSEVVKDLFSKEYVTLQPRLVGAYAKVLTHDEVKQLIAFYETPLGRRLIVVSPQLAQAGMQAGQAWAQELAPRLQSEVQRRLQAEGFVK